MSEAPEKYPVDESDSASTEWFENSAAYSAEEPRPDELPPVEPPSAGFIVQLFVVPGLIVLAVVGAWALFGKLTASQEDWRKLVVELNSGNEHRRWRAAMGLATMLEADQRRAGDVPSLAQNPQIARELAEMLQGELRRGAPTDADLKHQSFLTRTLGTLDVPETVVPVLQEAMQPEHDAEIRRDAVVASALLAHRSNERGRPLQSPELVAAVSDISADSNPLLRQVGAYTLGLLPSEDSRSRLVTMLKDADGYTRLNAAIGLARQGSLEGFEVFHDALEEFGRLPHAELSSESLTVEERRAAGERATEQVVAIDNALRALNQVQEQLTTEQSQMLRQTLQPMADQTQYARVRIEARTLLNGLE